MTTEEQIARVLELSEAATPGPWDAMATSRDTYVRQRDATGGAIIAYADATGSPTVEEYALIAEYRTLAPLLARKLERAMGALTRTRDSVWACGCNRFVVARQALDEIEAME